MCKTLLPLNISGWCRCLAILWQNEIMLSARKSRKLKFWHMKMSRRVRVEPKSSPSVEVVLIFFLQNLENCQTLGARPPDLHSPSITWPEKFKTSLLLNISSGYCTWSEFFSTNKDSMSLWSKTIPHLWLSFKPDTGTQIAKTNTYWFLARFDWNYRMGLKFC